MRPHLDYGGIVYDQDYNPSFHQKLELIQCDVRLAITGAKEGTWQEREVLGLESLQHRRWYKKLSYFHKFYEYEDTQNLFRSILMRSSGDIIGSMKNTSFFKAKQKLFFRNSFFPSVIIEWKNIDRKIRNLVSWELSDHLVPNSAFNSHNSKGIRFIAKQRLGQSHFQEHKFRHSFQDLLNKVCNGGLDVESTLYYLFHWPTRIIMKGMLYRAPKKTLITISYH